MAEPVDEKIPATLVDEQIPATAPFEAYDPEHRDELARIVSEALEAEDNATLRALIPPLHYADAADLLERHSPDQRRRLVEAIRADFDPEILCALDPAVRDEVIEQLGFSDFAAAVQELDSDDAVYLVGNLEEDERQRLMDALPLPYRDIIEQGLSYPEDSAGRLMQRELVAVPAYWTVGQTADFLRENTNLPDEFYAVYVVDPHHRPVGRVALSRLLRTRRAARLRDVLEPAMQIIPADMDQEEVAFVFRQHDLISGPVADRSGRLVGVITVDDVVDVIDAEAEDDMLRLGGVTEPDLYHAIIDTARARSSWLLVNLATAILASGVIALFSDTLQKAVALAVLMPIVASMGGNAGTQSLTVAVRSLAMKELTPANALRVVGKEVLVGLLNGVLFAIITGGVAWAWFGQPGIGLTIGAAMIINLVCAGFAGIVIPLTLERLRVDPAVASSVFVTTITDVVGFFAFLGLASMFL